MIVSNTPVQFTLEAGKWLFRIWGSQGGILNNEDGCKGAYSEGIFISDSSVTLYYFVGSQGSCSSSKLLSSKFGGGSNSIGEHSDSSCTGGAATFISRDEAANKILLISGAGGGMGQAGTDSFLGGFGGPFAGDSYGTAWGIDATDVKKVRGKGATYSGPGDGGTYTPVLKGYTYGKASPGQYLKGGDANSTAWGSSGGGGSGYYGGGGGADLAGGGGGSSYASPELYNAILLGGDRPFNSPFETVEKGHSGDGYIKIEPTDPYTIDRPTVVCVISKNCYCTFNFAFYIMFSFMNKMIPLGFFCLLQFSFILRKIKELRYITLLGKKDFVVKKFVNKSKI